VTAAAGDALLVQGMAADRVGDLAFTSGVPLHELTSAHASLEEAFMELTAASVEFHAGGPAPAGADAARDDGDAPAGQRVHTGGVG
jgi:ABC-2 type transport system ATP-binding protein